jgi:hypothetical protein
MPAFLHSDMRCKFITIEFRQFSLNARSYGDQGDKFGGYFILAPSAFDQSGANVANGNVLDRPRQQL